MGLFTHFFPQEEELMKANGIQGGYAHITTKKSRAALLKMGWRHLYTTRTIIPNANSDALDAACLLYKPFQ